MTEPTSTFTSPPAAAPPVIFYSIGVDHPITRSPDHAGRAVALLATDSARGAGGHRRPSTYLAIRSRVSQAAWLTVRSRRSI